MNGFLIFSTVRGYFLIYNLIPNDYFPFKFFYFGHIPIVIGIGFLKYTLSFFFRTCHDNMSPCQKKTMWKE